MPLDGRWAVGFLEAERARRGNYCQLQYAGCRGGARLEFAHTKPTKLNGRGRGIIRRALDIRKHPGCYVLACRRCHSVMDSVDGATR